MPSGIGYTINIPIRQVDAQDVLDAFVYLNNYQDKVDLGYGVLEPNPMTKEQFVASCCTQFMLNIYKNYMIEKAESDARVIAEQESAQRAKEVATWFDNLRTESYTTNPYTNYPVCVGGTSYQTYQNEPVTIELLATDPENLPLTFEILPSNNFSHQLSGNSLTVTPSTDFVGFTTVEFKAFNGTKFSQTVYHSLEVLSVAPQGQAISAIVLKNTPEDILLLGIDPKSKPLSYSIVIPPLNGSVTLNNGIVTYTPNTDVTGADIFSYVISNGTAESPEYFISVDILEN